jgi:exopolyphosphatase/guanosine-5'-triphosphate,3'-diphosphate pyrophosphatase
MQEGTLLAAVDLGSNSFRLEIGQLRAGHIERVEYLKETVRLGAGLNDNRELTDEAMAVGWACLARFGERLRGFDKDQVRAVATQTLREARNAQDFTTRGQQVLGFPIAVVPGTEEARLIYQGVSRLLPPSSERRLVIDIGGRSTEFVIGQGYEAQTLASFKLGSVSWSRRYFAGGELNAKSFDRAITAAQAILDEALDMFAHEHWDIALGASGTISAVADVLEAQRGEQAQITRQEVNELIQRLCKAKHVDRLSLPALKPERRAVIGGGLSVLASIMDLFSIDALSPAQGALRQGALYDLIERDEEQTDPRERTVRHLQQRFQVDTAQAERVRQTAQTLFEQVAKVNRKNQRYSHKLRWAAMVHEIGTVISHVDAPAHGAYLLAHIDAPGFAMDELNRLSQLVLAQRGKLRKVEDELHDELFVKQLFALRLAALLCHARRDPDLSGLRCQHQQGGFRVRVSHSWAANHPHSALLMDNEMNAWQKMGLDYRVEID